MKEIIGNDNLLLAEKLDKVNQAIAEKAAAGQRLSQEDREAVVGLVENGMNHRNKEFGGTDPIARDLNKMLEPHQRTAMSVARSLAGNDGKEVENPFQHEQLQRAYASEKTYLSRAAERTTDMPAQDHSKEAVEATRLAERARDKAEDDKEPVISPRDIAGYAVGGDAGQLLQAHVDLHKEGKEGKEPAPQPGQDGPVLEGEENVISEAKERTADIDPQDVADRSAANRARDREERERVEQERAEVDRLAGKAETGRINIENAEEAANERDVANRAREQVGQPVQPKPQREAEWEKNRQAEMLQGIHREYRAAGNAFMFKDRPEKVAFRDRGSKLTTGVNDERVAFAMATMAEAKGWKTINISGHPDFKREVWMEASLRGIKVKGFEPQEQDLTDLKARQERAERNSIEAVSTRDRQKPKERTDSAPRQAGREAATADTERPAAAATRVYAGKVLAHGDAPYNNDPKEKANYFVKLATTAGEKVVWGVDLKRAMGDGKAKVGDDVKLEYQGKQPVTITANVKDKAGKVIRTEEVQTHRNQWNVEKSEKHQIVEAVAAAVIDAKVKDPAQRAELKAAIDKRLQERAQTGKIPSIPVYDKNAPSQTKQAERERPVVERNAERTR